MNANLPPPPTFDHIKLSNTSLHYVRAGSGPPLIIVPATVSLLRQWLPLVQFMGQRYTAYFFELPGHGGSTAYPCQFDSRLVPYTVEELINAIGIERFNLMGFSFGGLLALRTLEHLQHRIDKVLLMSPFVSYRALKYNTWRRWTMRSTMTALKYPLFLQGAHQIMNTPQIEEPLIYALSKVSNVNKSILESKDALRISITTLDVLAHTVNEIFSTEYHSSHGKFNIPCYFGMSIYDDLLDYTFTENLVREHFTQLTLQQFTLPYHQPPQPPTFDWLNVEFGRFLDMIH